MADHSGEDEAAMSIDPEPSGVALRPFMPDEVAALDEHPGDSAPLLTDEEKDAFVAMFHNVGYTDEHVLAGIEHVIAKRLAAQWDELHDQWCRGKFCSAHRNPYRLNRPAKTCAGCGGELRPCPSVMTCDTDGCPGNVAHLFRPSETRSDYLLDGSPESVAIVREARGLNLCECDDCRLNRPGEIGEPNA